MTTIAQRETRRAKQDGEIEEVMEFFQFSVKPSLAFQGTILFKFINEKGDITTSYAVKLKENEDVEIIKDVTSNDIQATCEVGMTVKDFLWVYSGQASYTDLVKLYYAGKVSISAFAFRKVLAFAKSFDYSSAKWSSFYDWKESKHVDHINRDYKKPQKHQETIRKDWLNGCQALLQNQHLSPAQLAHWETSLSTFFGEEYTLHRLHQHIESRKLRHGQLILPTSSIVNWYLEPNNQCTSVLHHAPSIDTAQMYFNFVNADYVAAVSSSNKERFHARQMKNRVDLSHLSKDQLNKLVKNLKEKEAWKVVMNQLRLPKTSIDKDETNKNAEFLTYKSSYPYRKTNSKYVSAPSLLIHEFHVQTSGAVEKFSTKVLGREHLDNIPLPDIAWLQGDCEKTSILISPTEHCNDNQFNAQSSIQIVPIKNKRRVPPTITKTQTMKQKLANFSHKVHTKKKLVSSLNDEDVGFNMVTDPVMMIDL